ncbi:E3 ubiquitin ligase [Ascosphaera aggregata]|nr:E3 ubiquitin ligase [Ascosphaera aggregata]
MGTANDDAGIRDIVHYFTGQRDLLGIGETTEEHQRARLDELDRVEADKANKDPQKGGLFKGCFSNGDSRSPSPIHDIEDNVLRCPRCTHELEDGRCFQCGYSSYHSELDSDYDTEGETDYDEEFDDDDIDVAFMPFQTSYQSSRADEDSHDDEHDRLSDSREESEDDGQDSEMDDFIVNTDRSGGTPAFSDSDDTRESGKDRGNEAPDDRHFNENVEVRLGSVSENPISVSEDDSDVQQVPSRFQWRRDAEERRIADCSSDVEPVQPTRRRRGPIVEISDSDEENDQPSHNGVGTGSETQSSGDVGATRSRARRRVMDEESDKDENGESVVYPSARRRRLDTYRPQSDSEADNGDLDEDTESSSEESPPSSLFIQSSSDTNREHSQ